MKNYNNFKINFPYNRRCFRLCRIQYSMVHYFVFMEIMNTAEFTYIIANLIGLTYFSK